MKKYKKYLPTQTIHLLRGILNNLGVILYERHMIHKDFYSCRVTLGNDGLIPLNIGTNGKGRNFEYSMASGYAEFIERLQNRLLLNAKKMLTHKTYDAFFLSKESGGSESLYDKDEKYVRMEELSPKFLDEFAAMCGCASSNELLEYVKQNESAHKPLVVPFYDVKEGKEIELPIELLLLLTGSNGMASGNSPKEAILQALCEIFERYAICEIYWNELTPPSIPFSYFENTEIGKVLERYQQETNHKILIKDCSLGIGLPVLGLLIINEKERLYNFKLGVDFVPEIALERCFTEIHQGRNTFESLPYEFITTKDITDEERKAADKNLMKIFINGTGLWPISIIEETPSYEFSGFNSQLGISNVSDLKYSIDLISKMGHSIYIRNNSILGFPTYYVVIPGMSQILKKNPFVSIYKKSFTNLALINQMGRMDRSIARKIYEAIDDNYDILKREGVSLQKIFIFNVNKDLNEWELELLAAMLSIYLGETDNSIKYLELFLKDKDEMAYRYYYACLDYLKLKNMGRNAGFILTELYGEETAQEIISDLSDANLVFQYYTLPNCPNCSTCKLLAECKKKEIDKLGRNMNEQALPIRQIQTKIEIENDEE